MSTNNYPSSKAALLVDTLLRAAADKNSTGVMKARKALERYIREIEQAAGVALRGAVREEKSA